MKTFSAKHIKKLQENTKIADINELSVRKSILSSSKMSYLLLRIQHIYNKDKLHLLSNLKVVSFYEKQG